MTNSMTQFDTRSNGEPAAPRFSVNQNPMPSGALAEPDRSAPGLLPGRGGGWFFSLLILSSGLVLAIAVGVLGSGR
jgi:hypothetical protein